MLLTRTQHQKAADGHYEVAECKPAEQAFITHSSRCSDDEREFARHDGSFYISQNVDRAICYAILMGLLAVLSGILFRLAFSKHDTDQASCPTNPYPVYAETPLPPMFPPKPLQKPLPPDCVDNSSQGLAIIYAIGAVLALMGAYWALLRIRKLITTICHDLKMRRTVLSDDVMSLEFSLFLLPWQLLRRSLGERLDDYNSQPGNERMSWDIVWDTFNDLLTKQTPYSGDVDALTSDYLLQWLQLELDRFTDGISTIEILERLRVYSNDASVGIFNSVMQAFFQSHSNEVARLINGT